jgi:hypothetical protein
VIIRAQQEDFCVVLKDLWEKSKWCNPNWGSRSKIYNFERLAERSAVSDISFLLVLDKRPVIAFLGFIDNHDISTIDIPCITVEDNINLTERASRMFMKELDRIMQKKNVNLWYRDYIVDGSISKVSHHLLSRGMIVSQVFSKVIDLDSEEVLLKRKIRHSYKALINWGMRELNPQVLDSKKMTWDHMVLFRELHIRESGKVTRSEASWKRQYEMVKNEEAFVVFGALDNKIVTVGFFLYNQTNCYYLSSASRRDLFDKPLFHAMMWTAILFAKRLGCKWFEVGEIYLPNRPADKQITKKQQDISKFKAGFGGETRMFLDLMLDNGLDSAS